jgi:predicted AAA+ superfamily ATPase
MQYLTRELGTQLLHAARTFPAVVLTGPRRSGKTYLLKRLFPRASYLLLEDPDVVGRFRSDPQGFLDGIRLPVILDEVQHVPEAFNYIRSRIDEAPRRMGQWFLTGSRDSALMTNVTESMAGRAAVLQLLPFSARESHRVTILRGGYPEVLASPGASSLWFSSYVQTYLERDVRSVSAVHDLAAFRRFLALIASRHGGILNKSDIAAPLGMSVPGVARWLDILEVTAQVLVIPPFFENAGKRLIKSPKVYIADSGLACHLLGIRSAAELERSPFAGVLFEGFMASEIVKAQMNSGRRRELYYFRDQQGLEVDFIIPGKSGGMHFVEIKSTATPTPDMAAPMMKLAKAWKGGGQPRGSLSMVLVHQSRKNGAPSRALAPGVQAMPWTGFLSQMRLS